jgi:NAD(P)-dependent dehydrogenase (short-subunit alcohol dehydrogenase family)
MRLEGRVAIVTGAASGIGEATAALFREEGAAVLGVDRPGTAPAGEAMRQDLREDGAAERIVGEAMQRFGRLDVLVNNAGVAHNALAEQMADTDWDFQLDVNLKAMFRLCRAAIPHLKQSPHPRMVNVASVAAHFTDYGLAAYAASKAGVTGLTRTLALELGKFGITANWIEPGAIVTGMTRASLEQPEIGQAWGKKAALRRLGQPIDIARVALFLASDDAAFVTGVGLRADGGLMLRM